MGATPRSRPPYDRDRADLAAPLDGPRPDTFAGDVLARLGVDNAYAHHADRYPRVPLPELRAAAADLVVLPDEPYRFTADDGPEAFEGVPCVLVDGRLLTWYGPSLAQAPSLLSAALRAGPADARCR